MISWAAAMTLPSKVVGFSAGLAMAGRSLLARTLSESWLRRASSVARSSALLCEVAFFDASWMACSRRSRSSAEWSPSAAASLLASVMRPRSRSARSPAALSSAERSSLEPAARPRLATRSLPTVTDASASASVLGRAACCTISSILLLSWSAQLRSCACRAGSCGEAAACDARSGSCRIMVSASRIACRSFFWWCGWPASASLSATCRAFWISERCASWLSCVDLAAPAGSPAAALPRTRPIAACSRAANAASSASGDPRSAASISASGSSMALEAARSCSCASSSRCAASTAPLAFTTAGSSARSACEASFSRRLRSGSSFSSATSRSTISSSA
mmetsp:Transcript_28342/g.71156  ORF Transcript_28342/g.71156 Transcript_28342/m.71156 type:complete len:336 (-) Transcript_28342:1154-2161(-)